MKTLLVWLGLITAAWGQNIGPVCGITPGGPLAVNSGGTLQLTATAGCGAGLVWTVNGNIVGTVDGTGLYTAPASVIAQNQSRGCQELPNAAPINIRVDGMPVHAKNAQWLLRITQDGVGQSSYHNLKLAPELPVLFDNVVDNSTPVQFMQFYYGGPFNNSSFPLPPERNFFMEGGRLTDAILPATDRHWFSINRQNCDEIEAYNLYFDFNSSAFTPAAQTQISWTTNTTWPMPQNYAVYFTGGTASWAGLNYNGACSGGSHDQFGYCYYRMTVTGSQSGTIPVDSTLWGAANGALVMGSSPFTLDTNHCVPAGDCNAASGAKFNPGSYADPNGTDAAGMPLSAPSTKNNEWYAATQAGRGDLGHALRMTLSNWYLTSNQLWPAPSFAYPRGFLQLLSATNAATAVFNGAQDLSASGFTPCNNYTYSGVCTWSVVISGLTGAWGAANGTWTATRVDNTHFSIPVDSTAFGALPGSGQYDFDLMPYGTTIRLKASFNVNTFCASSDLTNWCPYAKVWLRTIQRYGMIMVDGTSPGDNWDTGGVYSEFHPGVLRDAAYHLHNDAPLQNIEANLEIVDRSSQIGPQGGSSPAMWMQSTSRTYVKVVGSQGQATTDIIPLGTTIGTDREKLTLFANDVYQPLIWVNGNVNQVLTYSLDNPLVGTVSVAGLITAANCSTKQSGKITVSHASDANALPLYIEVWCIPVGADGNYRIAFGKYDGDYTDTGGKVWSAPTQATDPSSGSQFNNWYPVPALLMGTQMGSWPGYSFCSGDTTWNGVTDQQLYDRSASGGSGGGDMALEVELPNGTYNWTLNGEPGFGGFGGGSTCGNTAGQNLFDLEQQGTTIASSRDGYVLAGNQPYHGWTLTGSARITDGRFTLVQRGRNQSSPYGPASSSLMLSPVSAGNGSAFSGTNKFTGTQVVR